MPALCSLESEWFLCLTGFEAYWQYLCWAPQNVSDCCALLHFRHIDNTCSWLFRK